MPDNNELSTWNFAYVVAVLLLLMILPLFFLVIMLCIQVRSLAAESFRAYQNGPLQPSFYREASSAFGLEDSSLPSQYGRMLDWFSIDLEGEHSAMDGRILEEHTEYVVYAIHRVTNSTRKI